MSDMPMSTRGHERLAAALRHLKGILEVRPGVVMAQDLGSQDRSVLVDAGFLRAVIKGWYVCSNPADGLGDSTAWYANFWGFVAGYLERRFGDRYCLSPEASVLLHTGYTVVPRQLVVVIEGNVTDVVHLPFDTSILIYPDPKRLPKKSGEVAAATANNADKKAQANTLATTSEPAACIEGLRIWSVADALCRCGPQFFKAHRREAEIALAMVRDVSQLIVALTDLGNRSAAARIAGALEFVGRKAESQILLKALSEPGQKLYSSNPFDAPTPSLVGSRERSPYVLRLRAMWQDWREAVIAGFPSAPGLPSKPAEFLKRVQERYVADAYNSLSIEGYQVTDELIERVASGAWSPDDNEQHKQDRDALAARGYFQTFGAVKQTLAQILGGADVSDAVRFGHQLWYAELFGPAVSAGILQPHQIAGYRSGPVFIRNSMHTPLPRDAILDSLDELWRLIGQEPEASVRAVLGHHLFVFIHPYFDGNGRIGRFLMNALFASGGYPWTVVRVARRKTYMQALESASVQGDINPLVKFLREEMLEHAV